MLQNIFCIIVIYFVAGGLLSCAHSPKQRTLIFKDDETENKVQYLQNGLKINPSDVESHVELGKIFLKEDFNEEAINEFERVLNIDSTYIEAYLWVSLALQRRPSPDLLKVAGLLEKAIQIAPDNANTHLNLAQVYGKLRKEEATTEFKRAIELSDDPAILVSAHLGLMAIYKEQGNRSKTMEEYEAAYKIYPGVEEMIKQAEISHITPVPKYSCENCGEENGLHPSLEERIKKLREELRKMSGGERSHVNRCVKSIRRPSFQVPLFQAL
jgi:tetratricopeptide (TPR) repeat protein